MKTVMHLHFKHLVLIATAAGFLQSPGVSLAGITRSQTQTSVRVENSSEPDKEQAPKRVEERRVIIQDLEPSSTNQREVAWLGLATEESSEAVTAQLGLKPGEGLVVTFVAPDSPAAKEGMQKNDLLVELDGQVLVHPAQFRKLIQMHKAGDSIKLTFYRAGKKDDASIKLAKTTLGLGLLGGENGWHGDLGELKRQLSELPIGPKVREEMQRLRENLAQLGIDKESVRVEVKRSMEEAQKALRDALRQATNAHRTFGPAMREMQELIRQGVDVDKDASIVVKSHRNEVRTMVKTDETGTYVIVANPKKHLTAHEKGGKLSFDGDIETAEQQEKVPREIWEKVEPMLDQMNKEKANKPEPEAERGE